MSLDLRAHFSIFRNAAPGRIHLAAHSHHYWPDVAVRAHETTAAAAARLADRKWGVVFETLIPNLQDKIARVLKLPDPATLAFAPNTHEFVCRLLSALPLGRPARVLTTDAEFHSFQRQIARLEEDGLVVVDRVAAEPAADFPARFASEAATPLDADHTRGNFLAFETREAGAIHDRLAAANIVTDVRGSRIRIGFGCYHSAEEIPEIVTAIRRALEG